GVVVLADDLRRHVDDAVMHVLALDGTAVPDLANVEPIDREVLRVRDVALSDLALALDMDNLRAVAIPLAIAHVVVGTASGVTYLAPSVGVVAALSAATD